MTITQPLDAAGLTLHGGDILVASGVFASPPRIRQYTSDGTFIQQLTLSYPFTQGVDNRTLRDLTVDSQGRIEIWQGTFNPRLGIYDPMTNSWSYRTFPEWNMPNTGHFGGVAALGDAVYASDRALGNDDAKGLVRFDLTDGSITRSLLSMDLSYVTLGRDGRLYGLVGVYGRNIIGIDPISLTTVSNVSLDPRDGDFHLFTSVAVDAIGNIFMAGLNGELYELSPTGSILNSARFDPGTFVNDLNLSLDGNTLIVTGADGTVWLFDKSFNVISSFNGSGLDADGHLLNSFSTVVPQVIPEPSSFVLAIIAIAAVAACQYRRGVCRNPRPVTPS